MARWFLALTRSAEAAGLVAIVTLVACGGPAEEPPPPPPRPSCPPPLAARAGKATFYLADGSGTCSFDARDDLFVAAMNGPDYDHAAWCGACLLVTGPYGEVLVRVVDRCPGCKPGDLDLSREAFELIAPTSRGRVPIEWLPVPCDVDGPLAYRFKTGSNSFWTAIQVRNHRYPIARLEIVDDQGQPAALHRADYNYFVGKSLGTGPYTLRVSDTRGHTVADTGIELGDGVVRRGAAQLPRCD